MFTRFVHLVLRMTAGAAFAVASAVVGFAFISEPAVADSPHANATPYPLQTLPIDTVAPSPITRDTFRVVMPVTPKVTVHSAPVKPRKSESYTTPVGVAQAYAASKISAANFSCLVNLWNKESGWNTHAYNPNGGAYGIPQSLPGDKMATFGSDWRDNYKTQINWGLNYIANVYGSACAAWQHSVSYDWY